MGITGDHQRLDATTIADAVNTAARLENLTKHYASEILLSEACLKSISGYENLHIRHLGRVQLKGKMEPITVYECFNGSDENNIQKKLSSLPVFNEAMTDYFSKSFKDATDKFSKVLEIHPDDMTTRLFLRNAHNYINNGVPENWTGIEEMRSMN
jgi:hypothetical protein